jgi:hypothetical protein
MSKISKLPRDPKVAQLVESLLKEFEFKITEAERRFIIRQAQWVFSHSKASAGVAVGAVVWQSAGFSGVAAATQEKIADFVHCSPTAISKFYPRIDKIMESFKSHNVCCSRC